MGLDLTLLPIDGVLGPDSAFSHTLIPCARDSALFERILDAEERLGQPVPKRFQTFTSRDSEYPEPHYGDTQRTPYGDPLRSLTAAQLAAIPNGPPSRVAWPNRAAWAYLDKMPPDTRIALYWH